MRSQTAKSPTTPKPMHRNPLPVDLLNPFIKNLDPTKPPTVKFQEIQRDGHTTVVARVKIPTPSGHAFILRRLDTGAISLTTMFRAAFPTASEDAERAESAWVKTHYDAAAPNKSGKARFAGTWVAPDVALALADAYALAPIIAPLARAQPDPNVVYRKSQRAPQDSAPASPVGTTPKDASAPHPPPAKRRRETSPTPTPVQIAAARSPRAPPTSTSTPATRRSARLKSPAPPLEALPIKSPRTAPRTKQVKEERVRTPPGDGSLAADEDVSEVSTMAAPNMSEDLREQAALLEELKAQRAAAERAKKLVPAPAEREKAAAVEEKAEKLVLRESMAVSESITLVEEVQEPLPPPPPPKRVREESVELKLNVKEPETEERAIVSNSRVRRLADMPPERKSLAWGALLFAAGMGAVSLLPSLPSFLS